MKQERFVALHRQEWDSLQAWLGSAELRSREAMRSTQALAFPALYRRLCHHLALARARGYSREVTDRLQNLVQQGHRVLYRPPAPRWHRVAMFLVADFPRMVRAEWRCIALAAVLLYVPMLFCLVLMQLKPELAHSVFGSAQLAEFEKMYDPANASIGRSSGSDLGMFGHYVMNNISIAFRTFASGLLLGVGAVYVMTTNGVIIGTVAGHLTGMGFGHPFWRFVVGHSSFELTALVISGGAGLRLGLTLLAPGRQRRGPAMVMAGWVGAQLALGAFAMLLMAAFIEAFWSSIASLPDLVKFGSGALLWLLVLGWLWRGGAERVRHSDGA
ncbi:stage II sporulation protein M [Dyella tabacisoli]|uniref:Stage II sporulation protein M n=1 Tax=Dyella tabacisoli TaxID=2282381 RepID=A0A369UIT4_9GAMM|nr:stage II sporulation protein M [Dyella tabacisoli]RDD80456.1 stage II sporulation protein M [Dyella tabacisoli]